MDAPATTITTTPDAVSTHWECENDAETADLTVSELASVGTPMCPECDWEMTLTETVTVTIGATP